MACDKCKELCIRYAIRLPGNLRKAISIASQNVTDGTLIDTTDPSAHSVSFAQLAAGQTWDDIVAYHFRCSCCGEQFSLHAETYHGSGGFWEPVRKAAIRENL
ncbi:hypothetical protein [Halothiobacillus neapolitanus]|uniref:Uncharacterized protein n=1 Tax=Halothiobacillus neapolitanus (strain ATCC 23641 / DSM 15147 / CIP 104769 / NCIMB 8539 / c2) TaxID=555778 RepID=D0KWF4_HALNC|nr:hypothetical protein [Halothiobacillus neapolitanus]ACX94951.1 conserved hypothetical protein [Halothiobacillus neapolitanus c2]TDN57205.1 hypothetical protein C8D83_1186 [Halothiobacillus neapolitanus]